MNRINVPVSIEHDIIDVVISNLVFSDDFETISFDIDYNDKYTHYKKEINDYLAEFITSALRNFVKLHEGKNEY